MNYIFITFSGAMGSDTSAPLNFGECKHKAIGVGIGSCIHRLLHDNGNLFRDNKGLLIVPGGGTDCPMAWDKTSQGVGQVLVTGVSS